MSNTITIYHGSVSIIEQPEFGKGKPHNDYGLGFIARNRLTLQKNGLSVKTQTGTPTSMLWICQT